MKTKFIIWEGGDCELITDSFSLFKSFFRTLPKEEWGNDYGLWCIVYDENKYTVDSGMDGEPYILDKANDEIVQESWEQHRDGLMTLPLDKEQFLRTNKRYAEEHRMKF